MTRTHVERLLDYLAGTAADDRLARDLREWVTGSRRYRAFAEEHRDKIRKKLRSATDDEPRADLRAELAVAHALLSDRRIDLAYEAFGSTAGGPDFSLAFRTHAAFTVEVTRWRGEASALERQVLAKLRQLPAGTANAVIVVVDVADGVLPDLDRMARSIRARADGEDDDFFRRQGLEGRRGFAARFRRLGGVYAWTTGQPASGRAELWVNAAARIPLPADAARAVLTCLGG